MAMLLHAVLMMPQPAACIATADDASCVEHTLRPLQVRACVRVCGRVGGWGGGGLLATCTTTACMLLRLSWCASCAVVHADEVGRGGSGGTNIPWQSIK